MGKLKPMVCRICGNLTRDLVDLGAMPPANRLKDRVDQPEHNYPLAMEVCDGCHSLQLGYCVDEGELYSNYLYITPRSPSLSAHYQILVEQLAGRGVLGGGAFAVEFGSNIGRFLECLLPHVGKVLGLDPAANITDMANAAGIPTETGFFGPDTARRIATRHGQADLVVARHCAAHNKDPHLLMQGVRALLRPNGVFLMENAYGLETLLNQDIGQIYHEHMFFFTITAVDRLMALNGLKLIDVTMSPVHGGSAVFLAALADSTHQPSGSVAEALAREASQIPGLLSSFPLAVGRLRDDIRSLVHQLTGEGHSLWLYGASAKASTLVNYAGLTSADIPFCVDSTVSKQGKFMPKSNIAIRPEEDGIAAAPDFFLLTAWNYKDEIIAKVRAAGNERSRFIVPHPVVTII